MSRRRPPRIRPVPDTPLVGLQSEHGQRGLERTPLAYRNLTAHVTSRPVADSIEPRRGLCVLSPRGRDVKLAHRQRPDRSGPPLGHRSARMCSQPVSRSHRDVNANARVHSSAVRDDDSRVQNEEHPSAYKSPTRTLLTSQPSTPSTRRRAYPIRHRSVTATL